MNNSNFKSKEHYLAFLKAWATAGKSDKAKTHTETRTSTYGSTHMEIDVTIDGWITSAHHVIYNILRDRTFHKGFTMVSNRNKLLNGMSPCIGLYQAVHELKYIQKMITQEAEHPKASKLPFFKGKEVQPFWGTSRIDAFLKPFDDIIDRDMIMALDIPEVKEMWTSYGQDSRVVVAILSGDYSPKNYDELMAVFAEVE